MGILIVLVFFNILALYVISIILLVKLIKTGVSCIKLGNLRPRDQLRLADTRALKTLWAWTLALTILECVLFTLAAAFGNLYDGIFIAMIFTLTYLSPQLALLIATKIVLKKYSAAFANYKAWERRQKAAASAPIIDAEIIE